ncbi:energy transducer TonB [Paludibacterium purpuratum]|uniref:Protein TonB n=1 Tax=Paludibacterium purpuratum TaxID=1144873 RepID=A0A4R7BE56_9NEIS|nr:energy transducer TonB [Paludibacterium purpuratum]TDR81947.1 protein TonB [Paludibacterium purpuratum]
MPTPRARNTLAPYPPAHRRQIVCLALALGLHALLFSTLESPTSFVSVPATVGPLQVSLRFAPMQPTAALKPHAPPPPLRAHALAGTAKQRPTIRAVRSTALTVPAPPPSASAVAHTATGSAADAPPPAIVPAELAFACPFRPAPIYPALSRRAGERGAVLLQVSVDESGHPFRVEIEQSSGFERLDQAAQAAVRLWRCNASRGAVTARQTIRFALDG